MKFLNVALPTLAVAFLAFLAGSYVMFAEAGPAAFLTNAYKAGKALVDQQTNYRHPYFSRFHQKARTDARGVTVYDPNRARDGFTLYTSGHDQRAFLISMNGDVLHEWDLPFSRIWNETSPVRAPLGDEYIYYRRAYLYPNGDLLVIYIASGDTPWGYGAARMTKDSELVWSYLGQAHHDFDVGADGKVYLLTHEISTKVIEAWTQLKPPRIDDFIVVLSPEGKELKKVSVVDALVNSTYGRMLTRIPWYSEQSGDYLHTNAIDVIEEADAEVFPFGKEGDVLISMRELTTGAIAVVDMENEVFTWATQGSWAGQHDPDIMENGNILLFDNRGEFGEHGTARVIEFDPKNDGIVWKYSGSAENPFESVLRSVQSRLDNGNTLITESDGGRLFEVTPDGEIVWEFINPVRGGENDEFIPIISSGERIDPKSLDPAFLNALSQKNS